MHAERRFPPRNPINVSYGSENDNLWYKPRKWCRVMSSCIVFIISVLSLNPAERSRILLSAPDRKKPNRLAANQSVCFARILDRKIIGYDTMRCYISGEAAREI